MMHQEDQAREASERSRKLSSEEAESMRRAIAQVAVNCFDSDSSLIFVICAFPFCDSGLIFCHLCCAICAIGRSGRLGH